jgi:hypothetical protein
MIQRELVVLEAGANAVRAFDFAHIDGREVLVIAELKWAAGSGVAQVINRHNKECWNTGIVWTGAVAARNVQHIRTEETALQIAIGADILSSVPCFSVENERRRMV